MIDVRELRVGDFVYLQSSKTPYRITEIGYSELEEGRYEASGISSESVFRTYIENINPIPLTDELLLRYRCEKVDNVDNYIFCSMKKKGEMSISIYDNHLTVENKIVIPYIQYLHQLQNFYFALTGKELDINS